VNVTKEALRSTYGVTLTHFNKENRPTKFKKSLITDDENPLEHGDDKWPK
jgi:hypothetical protein